MDHVAKKLKGEAKDLLMAALAIQKENAELLIKVDELWDMLQNSEEDLAETDALLAFAEKTIGELCHELNKIDERRSSPFYI